MAKNLDVMLDMLRTMKQMCADVSKKNYPGSHDQLEHGSWSESLRTDSSVGSLSARATMSPERNSRGEALADRAMAKKKDYTKNSMDNGATALKRCQDHIARRNRNIATLKKQQSQLDDEISKPEFAIRVMDAVQGISDAKKTGDKAKIAAAQAKYDEASEMNRQLMADFVQVGEKIKAADENLKQGLYDYIFINNAGTLPPEMDSGHSDGKIVDNNTANINAAGDFVARVTHTDFVDRLNPYHIEEAVDGRANVGADGVTMKLSADDETSTVAHELGHILEDQVPEIHASAVNFLIKRCNNEPEVKLSDVTQSKYNDNEICRKDQFVDPYMGKMYKDSTGRPYATELVSMGVQMLYENPQKLVEEDPEYFEWIIDTLRGYNV